MDPPVPYVDLGASRDEMQRELAKLRAEVYELRGAQAQSQETISSLRTALQQTAEEAPAVVPAEGAVARLVSARLPTEFGVFEVLLFRSGSKQAKLDRDGEIALVYGGLENLKHAGRADGDGALLRVHSSCFTGDVLGSHRCDCGEQLQASLKAVAKNGSGIVIYLHQEGRGIGLLEKLKAYNLQDTGLDTLDANIALGHPGDAREYSAAVAILRDLGIESVRLLTNNPAKVTDMCAAGINVVDRVPIVAERITKQNYKYLKTKAERMNHQLGARFLSGRSDLSEDIVGLCKEQPEPTVPTAVELPQDRPAVLYDNKPPFPVVDVNDLWLQSCGFQREEVIGKTMRLIQGPLTEGKEVGRLMDTIYLATMPPADPDRSPKWAPPSAAMWTGGGARDEAVPKSVSASLINYSKDRQAMRNDFEVVPVGAASEQLLSVSTFTPLDPAVQTALESTAAAMKGAHSTAADVKAVEDCLAVFRTGGMVLVADDEERENEGDLIVAAELITEEQVAFMVKHCTGIVCCPMDEEFCDRLKLPLMVEQNEEYFGTKFCVTVDGGPAMGVTTGVSAYDRAVTIRALANPATTPEELVRPGHIFPLRYTPGGVLTRGGHTEASVDLARWAGLQPAAAICELVKPDDGSGGMARRDDMTSFCAQHRIPSITIRQMQTYAKHKGEGDIAPKANQPTYAQLPEAAAPPVAQTELDQ